MEKIPTGHLLYTQSDYWKRATDAHSSACLPGARVSKLTLANQSAACPCFSNMHWFENSYMCLMKKVDSGKVLCFGSGRWMICSSSGEDQEVSESCLCGPFLELSIKSNLHWRLRRNVFYYFGRWSYNYEER